MPRRPPRLVSVKAAAEYLGVSQRTIRRMIDDGRLSGHRMEGSRFIRLDLNEIDDKLRPI
jgi:excisionase family DNA binding protein